MVADLVGSEHFPREARPHPMTPILDFSPTWIVLALLVVLLITATSASRRLKRGAQGRWDVKVCNRCGTSQPPHAAYCRQCGAHLP
jgi:ribosomal protein L40E